MHSQYHTAALLGLCAIACATPNYHVHEADLPTLPFYHCNQPSDLEQVAGRLTVMGWIIEQRTPQLLVTQPWVMSSADRQVGAMNRGEPMERVYIRIVVFKTAPSGNTSFMLHRMLEIQSSYGATARTSEPLFDLPPTVTKNFVWQVTRQVICGGTEPANGLTQ